MLKVWAYILAGAGDGWSRDFIRNFDAGKGEWNLAKAGGIVYTRYLWSQAPRQAGSHAAACHAASRQR